MADITDAGGGGGAWSAAAGAAGAVGSALSTVFAGKATRKGARKARKWNAREAQKNRDFQERMSGTAYQRAVQDMKMAGINPILAYDQGGASSPGRGQARTEDAVGPAISSAQHARRLSAELATMASNRELMYNQARLASNSAAREAANVQLTYKQQDLTDEQAESARLDNTLRGLQLWSARNVANVEKTKFGTGASFADRIRRMIFGGGSAVRPR